MFGGPLVSSRQERRTSLSSRTHAPTPDPPTRAMAHMGILPLCRAKARDNHVSFAAPRWLGLPGFPAPTLRLSQQAHQSKGDLAGN